MHSIKFAMCGLNRHFANPVMCGINGDIHWCALFRMVLLFYQIHQGAGYQALLDEGVQGRVEFGVRGHRLNDSKTEKAVVVYRKDHKLHWKVTAPMPKIVVSVLG